LAKRYGLSLRETGNFEADNQEHEMIKFSTDLLCVGCKDPVKNILGKAVVVQEGSDNITTHPYGAAGAKICCAGIIK